MSEDQGPAGRGLAITAHGAKGGYGCVDLLAGLTIAVALAICAALVAFRIMEFDFRRKHIPGHFLYQAFSTFPAITQLVYLVPLHIVAGRKERPGFQLGLWSGALLVLLGNGILIFAFMWHGD